jgi:hypothetical protein
MAARHIWVDGDVANASRLNAFPGGAPTWVQGSGQTGIGSTVTDLTGVSVTFTAEASRLYKTTLIIPRLDQITTTGVVTGHIANAASTSVMSAVVSITAGQFSNLTVTLLESGIAGSTTRKGRLATSVGSVNTVGGPFIIVEDLGPA